MKGMVLGLFSLLNEEFYYTAKSFLLNLAPQRNNFVSLAKLHYYNYLILFFTLRWD